MQRGISELSTSLLEDDKERNRLRNTMNQHSPSWRIRLNRFYEMKNKTYPEKMYMAFIIAMVLTSVVILVLETMPAYQDSHFLQSGILFFDIFFSLEFVLRCLSRPTSRKLCMDISIWVDFLSILPFYLELAFDGRIEGVNLLRILRTLRFAKYYSGAKVLLKSLRKSFRGLLVPLYFLACFGTLFAALIYYLERNSGSGSFESIPESLWFVMCTMTTVGYGDKSPVTLGGRFVAVCIMLFGVLFLAMSLALVGDSFTTIWDQRGHVLLLMQVREQLRGRSVEDAYLLWAEIDDDDNGTLDYTEFKQILDRFEVPISKRKMKELFHFFDNDNSGYITFEEFFAHIFPDMNFSKREFDIFQKKHRSSQSQSFLGSPAVSPVSPPSASARHTHVAVKMSHSDSDSKSTTDRCANHASAHSTGIELVTMSKVKYEELQRTLSTLSALLATCKLLPNNPGNPDNPHDPDQACTTDQCHEQKSVAAATVPTSVHSATQSDQAEQHV